MEKTPGKARLLIINFIRLLLVLAFFTALYTGRSLVFMISIVGLIATYIPTIMKKLFDITIPSEYEIISLLFIYGALFLSDVRGLFAGIWWWDILLNLLASVVLALVGLTVLYVLYRDKKISSNPIIIAFLTFCFAVAMGTMWEVLEFGLDTFYNFNLQNGDLRDTMGDLVVNAFGAILVSIAGYSYMKNGKIKVISEYVTKIIESNPKLFKPKNTLEESSKEMLSLISKGESNVLEFKSTLRTNLHTKDVDRRIEFSVLKTIVAFLNTQGGTLLIGVGDTGKVHGLENDRFQSHDALSLHFTNLLKTHIGNEFTEFIDFKLFPVNDKHVLKITCKKSPKPVFLKTQGDEEFHIRNGPSSVRLTPREAVEYIQNHFKRKD